MIGADTTNQKAQLFANGLICEELGLLQPDKGYFSAFSITASSSSRSMMP